MLFFIQRQNKLNTVGGFLNQVQVKRYDLLTWCLSLDESRVQVALRPAGERSGP